MSFQRFEKETQTQSGKNLFKKLIQLQYAILNCILEILLEDLNNTSEI